MRRLAKLVPCVRKLLFILSSLALTFLISISSSSTLRFNNQFALHVCVVGLARSCVNSLTAYLCVSSSCSARNLYTSLRDRPFEEVKEGIFRQTSVKALRRRGCSLSSIESPQKKRRSSILVSSENKFSISFQGCVFVIYKSIS